MPHRTVNEIPEQTGVFSSWNYWEGERGFVGGDFLFVCLFVWAFLRWV